MTAPARVADWMVRGYQICLRPLIPPVCRFAPSCSEYARMVLASHGLLSGGWLAARRIGRCHPWNPGGFDPPPPAPSLEERRF